MLMFENTKASASKMSKYKILKKLGVYYCQSSNKLANSESIDFLLKESLRIKK